MDCDFFDAGNRIYCQIRKERRDKGGILLITESIFIHLNEDCLLHSGKRLFFKVWMIKGLKRSDSLRGIIL